MEIEDVLIAIALIGPPVALLIDHLVKKSKNKIDDSIWSAVKLFWQRRGK